MIPFGEKEVEEVSGYLLEVESGDMLEVGSYKSQLKSHKKNPSA